MEHDNIDMGGGVLMPGEGCNPKEAPLGSLGWLSTNHLAMIVFASENT